MNKVVEKIPMEELAKIADTVLADPRIESRIKQPMKKRLAELLQAKSIFSGLEIPEFPGRNILENLINNTLNHPLVKQVAANVGNFFNDPKAQDAVCSML